jgi:uncharacterized membrane protein YdfJ with MMPL/SSD domain
VPRAAGISWPAVLPTLPVVAIAELGLVVAIGILLDTLVVRPCWSPPWPSTWAGRSGGRAGRKLRVSSRSALIRGREI